ncbi:MFS transporter [Sphingobium lactosutens]|uniref:MFS transporter n=1 Tax=Sphingobium lactosutens TaxID=522773 RepID=UPI0015BB1E1A|nr:MFS transporter [Sphingobium lactosutens]
MTEGRQALEEHSYPPPSTSWRAVAVLTTLYWFGTLDRQVAALLLPLIKADLNLTDSQVSLIPGLAFGLAFMLMSLPIGWLVDRISRRAILFVGVIMWSLAAMGSGLSRTFGQLFGARVVVGASEATINPTAYSLLSDFFPPAKLTLPMSIFTLGGNLGSGTSFMLGGMVIALVSSAGGVTLPVFGTLAGWQAAFVVTGLPGLLLAFLVWTFPETRRRKAQTPVAEPSTFGELGRHYRRFPAFYVLHHLGIAMIMAFAVGIQSWNSAYLSRHFGWQLADIGFWLGLTQVLSSLLGLWFHGWAVDKIFSRGRQDAHLIYFGAMCALACPFGVAAYLMPSAVGTIAFYNVAYFLLMAFASIGPAALQIATPPRLRGKATAVYMIVLSILGTIMGPIIVASFTDLLFQDEAKLGSSMALFAGLTTAIGAICCWAGRAAMRRAVSAQTGQARTA